VKVTILLDVDGVLVHDGGYRAGVAATVDHFAAGLGLQGMAPTEEEIDAFHAAGFTNEWDINPFVVGILWLAAAGGKPVRRPDYRAWAARSGAHPGRPSQRALALLQGELARQPLDGRRQQKLAERLAALLADAYDVRRCPTTQVFQEYILGSRLYAEYYGLVSQFATPSLLEQEDRPALTAAGRACLERLAGRGAGVCIYTARPSGPPAAGREHPAAGGEHPAPGREAEPFALAPEAELAVELLHLERYPLVARGRMQWLADRYDERAEALTKPSPVQVLAALGAAIGGEEVPALEAAYALYRHGRLQPPLAALAEQPCQVFVLEDATPGLQAAAEGQRLLSAQGCEVRVRGVGVTASPAKAKALAPYCETLVADVNAGLAWIKDQIVPGIAPEGSAE
jgi:phosphoglycolate phosphatase-like HAD superfamily hydrolase